MSAGKDPLPQPFCLCPHLSSSARVCSFPSGCVCKSVFLGFVHFLTSSLYLHPPTHLPFHLPFLGCVFPPPSNPLPIFLCPRFSPHTCVPISPARSPFLRSWPVPPPSFPSASPHPAYVSLHPLPRLSPHTLLPGPKETVVLNSERLRCSGELQLLGLSNRGTALRPTPTAPSTFPTCCMPGGGAEGRRLRGADLWEQTQPRSPPRRRRRLSERRRRDGNSPYSGGGAPSFLSLGVFGFLPF